MLCVNGCEFQKFDKQFYCKLYETNLIAEQEEDVILIERCSECVDEDKIGSSSTQETIRKLKVHVGWMMDFFYSFKDDIEGEVTHIYRLLKELEKEK
jgi:hypothetical protein